MNILNWNTMQEESLGPLAGRKVLHAEKMTVARFRFDKGNKVALHHHPNDQVTMVMSGSVRFVMGDEETQLKAGEFIHVPPDVPHANEALEDTVIIEIFSPVRQDWITGDDSYLRK